MVRRTWFLVMASVLGLLLGMLIGSLIERAGADYTMSQAQYQRYLSQCRHPELNMDEILLNSTLKVDALKLQGN